MARFFQFAFALALPMAPALAQTVSLLDSPIVVHEPRPEPSFDIPDDPANSASQGPDGSRIIAGTELMPNSMIGFGMFGDKADQSALAPATARDLALPKSRKAAVGFSLRF